MTAQAELFGGAGTNIEADNHAIREPSPRKATSQCGMVLRWMEVHDSISDMDAFTHLGIRRLAARIFDLRQDGWAITTADEAHVGVKDDRAASALFLSPGE